MSLATRLRGVLFSPRAAMAAALRLSLPAVLVTWGVLLALWAAMGGALLSTHVGRQALVDERVRVVESLGGDVDDQAYARLQASPPTWVYLFSGGRSLLLPPVTLAVAAGLFAWLRSSGNVTFVQTLSIAVHATWVLVVQQALATPLHIVRESLTSPFNLGALLPFFDEGSLPARFLGTIEGFGVWWVLLVAIGCGVLAERQARAYLRPLLGFYVGTAAVVAIAVRLTGGS